MCARFSVFKSDSNHRAIHQSTQYFMVDRSKACEERGPGKLQAPVLEEGAGKRRSECERAETGKILPHTTRQPRNFSSGNRSTRHFLERVALYRLFNWLSLSPHLHTPFHPFCPSLISLVVSVDVKHHVYLLPRVRILCKSSSVMSPRIRGSKKRVVLIVFCFSFVCLFVYCCLLSA